MATQKPPRIILCLTTPRTHAADRFWLGLARVIEQAGYNPLFLLPASDTLVGMASREAYRVVESGRGEAKEILREVPAAAALVDSARAKNGIRAALPWLPKDKIRRVLLSGERLEETWFFLRTQSVLYPSPLHVGSSGANDLWLPLQPGRILVSEDRTKEFRREYNLSDTKRIIWMPGGSRVRTRNWMECVAFCEQLLTNDPENVIAFGRAVPIQTMNTLQDHLHRFGADRLMFDLSESEEERVWSAASVVWLQGFDSEELFEPLIRAVEVGLPVLVTEEDPSQQWVAAGFGDEAISRDYPGRWVEKSFSLSGESVWERRRTRIRDFEERWGLAAQAKKLLTWLDFPLLPSRSAE